MLPGSDVGIESLQHFPRSRSKMQNPQHCQASFGIHVRFMDIDQFKTRISQPPKLFHFRSAKRALSIVVKRIDHHDRKYDADVPADDPAGAAFRNPRRTGDCHAGRLASNHCTGKTQCMALSRTISSNQAGCHPRLAHVVRKHLSHEWQRPPAAFSGQVFDQVRQWLEARGAPLILDSGCGTAASSISIAQQHPDCSVLGFDRSAVRLRRRQQSVPPNCMLIRADAQDLWRQLASHEFRTRHHFLLYPNPYPKASQLNSRWHGSPAFPALLSLGGEIDVRSNWKTYLDEFQQALGIAGFTSQLEPYEPRVPLTLFEQKYANSGHALWRLTASLDASTGEYRGERPEMHRHRG